MRHLLEGGTYSDLSVNGAALIRGWCVFETQFILEEKRYIATQINFCLDKNGIFALFLKIVSLHEIWENIVFH